MSIYDELVHLGQFNSALQDIKKDIEAAQEKIEKAERTQNTMDHMQAGLALSGVEIKMTNFAQHLRERFQ